MDRKFLEEMGLEKETIDKVMKEHGKTLNDYKEKAEKHDGLVTQVNDLTEQLGDRDKQLKELKKVDPKALQDEIDRLEELNETTANEYQEKLDQQAFDFKLERSLVNAGVRNPKAVKALLDTESIKLDGEKLLGLDGQLEALKETDDYLFQSDNSEKDPQIVNPGNPNGGGNGAMTKADIMKEPDSTKRQQLIQENMHLFK